MSEVAVTLGRQAKVPLKCGYGCGDQRVTLVVVRQPLHRVMERLTRLLAHSPSETTEYVWTRESGAERYTLTRTSASREREQRLLAGIPDRLREWLRELRVLARQPPAVRARSRSPLESVERWKTRPDLEVYLEALADLPGAEFARLQRGERVELQTPRFARKASEHRQAQLAALEAARQRAITRTGVDPYPAGLPPVPEVVPKVYLESCDQEGDNPRGVGYVALGLTGVLDSRVVFQAWPDRGNLTLFPDGRPAPDASRVDLAPFLGGRDVTEMQRGDAGFHLRALALATRTNLYVEQFYKPAGRLSRFGGRSRGLSNWQGTVAQHIWAIADEWDYRVEKAGEDLLFWPISWPFDRAADVPRSQIETWRGLIRRQNGAGVDLLGRIASRHSQAQLRQTLELALSEAGSWPAVRTLALQFRATLNPAQLTLLHSQGLPVGRLTSAQQQRLVRLMRQRQPTGLRPPAVAPDILARCRVSWSPAPPSGRAEVAPGWQVRVIGPEEANVQQWSAEVNGAPPLRR